MFIFLLLSARRSGGFEIRRLKRFDRFIGDLQSPGIPNGVAFLPTPAES